MPTIHTFAPSPRDPGYNYDTERVRRCVIQYSKPDGMYPFCTLNCGPIYRPFIEGMSARPLEV